MYEYVVDPFTPKIWSVIPYCPQHKSYEFSTENFVLDHLIIP